MLKPEGYTPKADTFEYLYHAKERGLAIEAEVAGVAYPNGSPAWLLTFPGLDGARGLVPASETGLGSPQLMPRFVGQKIRVKVKGLDRESGLAACSRREVVAEAEERLKAELRPGQVIEALVRAVLPRDRENGKPARLLLDVGGGVLVEIPYRKAAVSQARSLAQQFPPGSTLEVEVVSVEPLVVSPVKKTDPWQAAPDFHRGQFLACTVVAVRGSTVFLEPDLAPGVVGIAPVPLRGAVARGDRVTCAVAKFDREKKKLHLRLRGRI
ncbi:hypothetical protein [Desulfovirgula thermocuniculi]|uniref:hypothetical protein n=1 Tax=Desulfovirgula thermocuniculi TaxID=348842 RepID=UPI000412E339|nr:hypothetical protein [Desulfovirgula thermocuniculi]